MAPGEVNIHTASSPLSDGAGVVFVSPQNTHAQDYLHISPSEVPHYCNPTCRSPGQFRIDGLVVFFFFFVFFSLI